MSWAVFNRIRLSSLSRILHTGAMETRARCLQQNTAFMPCVPLHECRFIASNAICQRRSDVLVSTPRRPRARISPARNHTPALCGGAAIPDPLPAMPAPARTLVTLPEQGPDGLPIIEEQDLEEQFVRGSGPGGQKINKTASCVVLKHIPTGVTVRCQEGRSQMKNRQLARKILRGKLDEMIRGEESLAARELSKARARKAKRRRKSVKKHFKSRRDKAIMDDRMGN